MSATTTLKLSDDLKARIAVAAEQTGKRGLAMFVVRHSAMFAPDAFIGINALSYATPGYMAKVTCHKTSLIRQKSC